MTDFFGETPEESKARLEREQQKWNPDAIKNHYDNLPEKGQPRLEGRVISGIGSDFEHHARRLVGDLWDVPLTADEIADIERPLTSPKLGGEIHHD